VIGREEMKMKSRIVFFVFRIVCTEPVDTAQGPVQGTEDSGSCSYKGVPYAAPPVGELRWKAPREAEKRSRVLVADSFGNKCPQIYSRFTGGDDKTVLGDEDCLYLNIWRPEKSGRFPVMFWIHGGALIQGSADSPLYHGDRLAAEKDVVVVTINYRLGAFGFLSHPEFAEEDPRGGAGNYGLLDQVKALEWVRDNIEGFGGDPGNVTIFGESAGGWSVCMLMASPLAEGLFRKAVIESGGCENTLTVDQGYEHGLGLAAELGCEGPGAAECLRSLSVREIFAATKQPGLSGLRKERMFDFLPKVDGHFLDETPMEALRSGRYNMVPLIVGSTRDEMKFFTAALPGVRFMPPGLIKAFAKMNFKGQERREFRRMYPYREYRLPADAVIDAMGDAGLGCANFKAAEAAELHRPAVYYYRFDYDDNSKPHALGAPHGVEIAFVFDKLDVFAREFPLYSEEHVEKAQDLVETVSSYWVNFAYTGDPNGEGLPPWPEYAREDRLRMYLDLPCQAGPTDNVEKCGFWDKQSFFVE